MLLAYTEAVALVCKAYKEATDGNLALAEELAVKTLEESKRAGVYRPAAYALGVLGRLKLWQQDRKAVKEALTLAAELLTRAVIHGEPHPPGCLTDWEMIERWKWMLLDMAGQAAIEEQQKEMKHLLPGFAAAGYLD